MRNSDTLDSFWYFSTILFRNDDFRKSEFRCFSDTFFEEEYIFHHSGKRYFSEIECIPERFSLFRAHHRSDSSEIDSWFCERKSSTNIGIDIVTLELCVSKFRHDSDEEFELSLRYTSTRSFRIAKLRICRQCLDLYKEWTIPFDRESKRTSRKVTRMTVDKFQSWIRKINQTRLKNKKKSYCISRSKSVF